MITWYDQIWTDPNLFLASLFAITPLLAVVLFVISATRR